jgi:hypothetical protein
MTTMRTTQWLFGILVIGLLACAGCRKSESPAQTIPASMDLSTFLRAFSSPTPAQEASIAKVTEGVRYRLYPNALAALKELASDPTLSGPQKQAVSNMLQGVEQAMTNAPAAAPK